ncbi:glycosyltransferase [Gordonia polyisoprenivorans]|uniref:glycosyltransferase n=1 Tax=Gordonia polyisoprenivorans TaxID=84595 RepID=UPI003A5BD216
MTITMNDADGLIRTLQSTSSQRGEISIEHIVADGSAQSDSVRICQEYSQDAVVLDGGDTGRYHGMNRGLSVARGKYIWFLNSGDIFHDPYSAAAGVEALRRKSAPWGYGLARKISKNGDPIAIMGVPNFNIRRFALGGRIIPHQSSIFATEFARSLGGYDQNHGLAADQLFMLRAATAHSPTVVCEFLADFLDGGAGSVRRPWDHYRDMGRARRTVGMTSSGSRLVDSSLSLLLCAGEVARRRAGALL